MIRWLAVVVVAGLAALGWVLALGTSPAWWWAAAPLTLVAATGVHDLLQRRHSILRNYPVLGHARFALEHIRPEIQQYFIERTPSPLRA